MPGRRLYAHISNLLFPARMLRMVTMAMAEQRARVAGNRAQGKHR